MYKVWNISRRTAQTWGQGDIRGDLIMGDNVIWISIGEPHVNFNHINNPILDAVPNLKIQFWDTEDYHSNFEEYPGPSEKDAERIVDFLIDHPNKDVVVNCAAGVSRSGAIAQFCHDVFGYGWILSGRDLASPNKTLYKLMRKYFVNRKRR